MDKLTKEQHKELDLKIAQELNLPSEIVHYIRPRLLSDYYNADIKKLIDRVEFHKKEAEYQLNKMLLRNTWRKKKVEANSKFKEVHERKIKSTEASLEGTKKNIPFYSAVVAVLNVITDKELKILMQ